MYQACTKRLGTMKSRIVLQVCILGRYALLALLGVLLGYLIRGRSPVCALGSQGNNFRVLTSEEFHQLPTIFVITPTYTRLTQRADMTRLSNTLNNVKKVHWVVVEDSKTKTKAVTDILARSGCYRISHLHVATPVDDKKTEGMARFQYHRGVEQRNLALRAVADLGVTNAVVYFADDDNSYDLDVFEEMRLTKKVSIWPVAFVGGQRYERPIVTNGKVTGWHVSWHPERTFPADMAAFAFHASLLKGPNGVPQFSHTWRKGFLETGFLELLISGPEALEPRANMCTRILVWHTRTEPPFTKREAKLRSEAWMEV